MKRRVSVFLAALLLISAFSSALPVLAETADGNIQVRSLPTYLYSMNHAATTDALFTRQLPTIPYLDAEDFFDHIYTVDFSTSKNADGTYSITSENGVMVADAEKDTLYFDGFEFYILSNVDKQDSVLANDYAITAKPVIEGETKGLTLDLGAYGIDLIEYGGRVYLPLPTLSDLVSITYNSAEYIDGNLYYVHTYESASVDGYFDRSPLYQSVERDPAASDFTYRELCFCMDHFYGAPEKAQIAESIREKGFDKALDEYSDGTRTAKALLKSNDLMDFFIGLMYLDEVFFDGGHTSLTLEMFLVLLDTESPLYEAMEKKYAEHPEYVMAMMHALMNMQDRETLSRKITPLRDPAYEKYELVKSWGEDARFIRSGDTGVFVFDSFIDEVVELFKWSLDWAVENGIKNFAVDLTCSGGGSSDVAAYIFTVMMNGKAHSNVFDLRTLFTTTGNIICEKVTLDLNLDGVFDEKDCDLAYDLNFAVLSTPLAFSSGNLLPCLARDNGIAVLGETSGGGSCALSRCYAEGCHYFLLSSPRKIFKADGSDADSGSGVDYYLVQQDAEGNKDYSGLYDLDDIGVKMHEFYGN